MAKIIPFKTRAQLEQERKAKIQSEWEEWLSFEDQYLRETLNKERATEATEKEIIDDVKQRLTEGEMQGIKEIAALLDRDLGKQ
ncbi:hypothetical protein ACFOGI_15045 [Virgibacillus xinjiangensis]|uniref:Uncharacterized protein n=1 Tax=Virgibacillus xinjiangensis TaxID=393090 RepID=A0ABV7CYG7_9BACI